MAEDTECIIFVVRVTVIGRSECGKCSCGAGGDHFEEQSVWS